VYVSTWVHGASMGRLTHRNGFSLTGSGLAVIHGVASLFGAHHDPRARHGIGQELFLRIVRGVARSRTPTFIAIDCNAIDCNASRPMYARRKRPGSLHRVSAQAAPHRLVATEPLLPDQRLDM
jgi:hypothetical protein